MKPLYSVAEIRSIEHAASASLPPGSLMQRAGLAAATVAHDMMSGQTVLFQTALAVVCLETGFEASELAVVKVVFRQLDDATIERYLRAEQPYDCAGSAKSEGLGIALLDRIDNDDPTALIGLPLIHTARLLRQAGLQLP